MLMKKKNHPYTHSIKTVTLETAIAGIAGENQEVKKALEEVMKASKPSFKDALLSGAYGGTGLERQYDRIADVPPDMKDKLVLSGAVIRCSRCHHPKMKTASGASSKIYGHKFYYTGPNGNSYLTADAVTPGLNIWQFDYCTADPSGNNKCYLTHGKSAEDAFVATDGKVQWSQSVPVSDDRTVLFGATLTCQRGGEISFVTPGDWSPEQYWTHLKVGELKSKNNQELRERFTGARGTIYSGIRKENLIKRPETWPDKLKELNDKVAEIDKQLADGDDEGLKAQKTDLERDISRFDNIFGYDASTTWAYTYLTTKLLSEIPQALKYDGADPDGAVQTDELTEWMFFVPKDHIAAGRSAVNTGFWQYMENVLRHYTDKTGHKEDLWFFDKNGVLPSFDSNDLEYTDEGQNKLFCAKYPSVAEEIMKGLIWDDNKVDAIVIICNNLYEETGVYVDPRLVMAVLFNEGTGSFNTMKKIWRDEAEPKGNVTNANHEVDLRQGLERMLWGKCMAWQYYYGDYKRRCRRGWPSPADLFGYINNYTVFAVYAKKDYVGKVDLTAENYRDTIHSEVGVYAGAINQANEVRMIFSALVGEDSEYCTIRYSEYVARQQRKIKWTFDELFPRMAGQESGTTEKASSLLTKTTGFPSHGFTFQSQQIISDRSTRTAPGYAYGGYKVYWGDYSTVAESWDGKYGYGGKTEIENEYGPEEEDED